MSIDNKHEENGFTLPRAYTLWSCKNRTDFDNRQGHCRQKNGCTKRCRTEAGQNIAYGAVRHSLRPYIYPEEQYQLYKGQELVKGDIVQSDVYFTKGKDIRVCELLYKHKKGIWKALEIKGDREVLIEEEMVLKVLVNDRWHKRHERPEKYKYYWQTREKDES